MARRGRASDGDRGARSRSRGALPTLRGAIVGLTGVAAIAVGYRLGVPELVPIGTGAVVLVLAGLAAVATTRPRLEVERTPQPPTAAVGRPVRVQVRLRNVGGRPARGLTVEEPIGWGEPAIRRGIDAIPSGSGAWAEVAVEYVVVPPRRGRFALGPVRVERSDPFGLAREVLTVGAATELAVVPHVAPIGDDGPALDQGDGLASSSAHRATDNEDDLTTREYRAGDALRRVHWRATAKQGELMVRQEEARSDPDARLLIDTRVDGYPDAAGASTSDGFEWVVRMAASLAAHLELAGFRVDVEESAPDQLEAPGRRRMRAAGMPAFLDSLAGVALLEQSGSPRPETADAARGPVFALLGEPSAEVVAWLLARHDPRDTAVAFLAGGSELTLRRLEAAGWAVVAIDPEDDPAHAWREASRALARNHERR